MSDNKSKIVLNIVQRTADLKVGDVINYDKETKYKFGIVAYDKIYLESEEGEMEYQYLKFQPENLVDIGATSVVRNDRIVWEKPVLTALTSYSLIRNVLIRSLEQLNNNKILEALHILDDHFNDVEKILKADPTSKSRGKGSPVMVTPDMELVFLQYLKKEITLDRALQKTELALSTFYKKSREWRRKYTRI